VGKRQIVIRQSAAESIAKISWYIESKGMFATAEQFADASYDFIEKLADQRKSHRLCRDPDRSALGFKCVSFRKKYTVVFIETDIELAIIEFIPSKLIRW